MITIRPSNIKAFLECPKRWLLDSIQPKHFQSEATIFGTNVHKMLEQVIENDFKNILDTSRLTDEKQLKKLPLEFFNNMKNDLNAANIKPTMRAFDKIGLKVLTNFKKQWQGYTTAALECAIERGYDFLITENIKLSGIPDVVLVDSKNAIIILDIKTMASKRDISYHLLQLATYAFLLEKIECYSTKELGVIKIVKKSKFEVEIQTISDLSFIEFLVNSVKTLINHIVETYETYLETRNEYLFKKNFLHWTCNESLCAHYLDCQAKKEIFV